MHNWIEFPHTVAHGVLFFFLIFLFLSSIFKIKSTTSRTGARQKNEALGLPRHAIIRQFIDPFNKKVTLINTASDRQNPPIARWKILKALRFGGSLISGKLYRRRCRAMPRPRRIARENPVWADSLQPRKGCDTHETECNFERLTDFLYANEAHIHTKAHRQFHLCINNNL